MHFGGAACPPTFTRSPVARTLAFFFPRACRHTVNLFNRAVDAGLIRDGRAPAPVSGAYLVRSTNLREVHSQMAKPCLAPAYADSMQACSFDVSLTNAHLLGRLRIEDATACIAYPVPRQSTFQPQSDGANSADGGANASATRTWHTGGPSLFTWDRLQTVYPQSSCAVPGALATAP